MIRWFLVLKALRATSFYWFLFSVTSLPELKGSIIDSSPMSPSNINLINNKELVATNVDSSIDSTINKSKNLNLDGKVKFVKNKR